MLTFRIVSKRKVLQRQLREARGNELSVVKNVSVQVLLLILRNEYLMGPYVLGSVCADSSA